MPKPFNLERAQAGDKVVTRAGDPYKFGAYNKDAKEYEKVLGWINGAIVCHSENGTYWEDPEPLPNDLFMADDVPKYSMNVYANKSDLTDFLEGTRSFITLTSKASAIPNDSLVIVELNWDE